MYTLEFTLQAIEDLKFLKKSEPSAFKKAQKLITELQQHPKLELGNLNLRNTIWLGVIQEGSRKNMD